MTDNMNHTELARLARLFRQFALETYNPEFKAKFLNTAEEFERTLKAGADDNADREMSR